MKFAFLPAAALLGGCAVLDSISDGVDIPSTKGEQYSDFGYVPMDPSPVIRMRAISCSNPDTIPREKYLLNPTKYYGQMGVDQEVNATIQRALIIEGSDAKKAALNASDWEDLPGAFPDNTVRIGYKSFSGDGTVSFGPVSLTQKGGRYQVTIDYLVSDIVREPMYVRKRMDSKGNAIPNRFDVLSVLHYKEEENLYQNIKYQRVEIPVIVGVGLRITADVKSLKGKGSISGLDALGLAVENNEVVGSLVVQAIGINGPSITAAMPIQSDLNQTTVQNAIVAVASIKTRLFDPKTIKNPRVMGFRNTLGGDQDNISQIVSNIGMNIPVMWHNPCKPD